MPQTGLRIENNAIEGDPMLQFAVHDQVMITMGIDGSDDEKFKVGSSALTTTTMLTLDRNGYVGIGTTEPEYNLHVEHNRPANYVAWVRNTNATGSGLGAISNNSYNALGGITENHAGIGVYGAHIPAEGVGWGVWGTSNSSNGIGVKGSVPTTGSWLGYGGYFTGGLAYVNGLYNLSDARMKKDVHTLQGSLAKVARLRGVSYQYNNDEFSAFVGNDKRTYIGFVAQEVESVFPEAVAEKNLLGVDGNPANAQAMGGGEIKTVKVVDYVSLVPVLVEAIKEQQAQIEKLENRVRELELEK